MMVFEWVILSELRLFESFPTIIMVDTVGQTSNKKSPLLTVGDKDSNGEMVIFLKCFMPKQQSWMSRWIFSVVIPSLDSKKLLKKVIIIISDGDLQFFTQIDNAIGPYFKNAKKFVVADI